MTGVSSRLDHCYRHPGVFEPVERELGQGGSDAVALVVGVDGQHGGLAHAAFGMMELDRHEADDARAHFGDPHPPLLRGADLLHRPPLIFSPVRVLSPENLGTHRLFERREDRRPCSQREVNYHLSVSIFKWSNPWLHRFTSRYPAAKY